MASVHLDEFAIRAVGLAHEVVKHGFCPTCRNWVLDVSNFDFDVLLSALDLEEFFTQLYSRTSCACIGLKMGGKDEERRFRPW